MTETELRIQRLVIVDVDGRDRVVIEAGRHHGSVLVRAASTPGTTGIELYAVDAVEADGPEVGVALVVDGDVVGGFRFHAPWAADDAPLGGEPPA